MGPPLSPRGLKGCFDQTNERMPSLSQERRVNGAPSVHARPRGVLCQGERVQVEREELNAKRAPARRGGRAERMFVASMRHAHAAG